MDRILIFYKLDFKMYTLKLKKVTSQYTIRNQHSFREVFRATNIISIEIYLIQVSICLTNSMENPCLFNFKFKIGLSNQKAKKHCIVLKIAS